MQKCIHLCINMQASAQERRRAWPGSSANIRQENRENVAQLARVAAADTIQAGEFAGGVASGLASTDRRVCVKRGTWLVTVEPLASLVVCSRCIGCVDRLRVTGGALFGVVAFVDWLQWLADGVRVGYPCGALVCVAYMARLTMCIAWACCACCQCV